MVKRFRSVLLPDEIDLYWCSDSVEHIVLGGMHHSGPAALFARIAHHLEFGPVAHAAHVNLFDFALERVKRQATRFNILPPLTGAKHAVSRLDSKVLCSSRSPLNVIDCALVLLELVNDGQWVPRMSRLLNVTEHDPQSGEQLR
jgi:hypothetical protein